MTEQNRRIIIIAGIVVVIVALFGVRKLILPDRGVKIREIIGNITSVDPVGRKATLEFIQPSTKQTISKSGTVPKDCKILLDDKSASIGDIKVGDRVTVKARIRSKSEQTDESIELISINAHHVKEGRTGTSTGSGPAARE